MDHRTRTTALASLASLALLLPGAGTLAQTPGAPAPAAGSAPVEISITGLRSVRGKVVACLWRDQRGFPSCGKSATARRIVVPVSAATMSIRFPDVAPGRYAVTVEHDENGDGKSGRNLIGMPTEGVGVSNNPGGMPGWAKSLVTLPGAAAVPIRIRYLFR